MAALREAIKNNDPQFVYSSPSKDPRKRDLISSGVLNPNGDLVEMNDSSKRQRKCPDRFSEVVFIPGSGAAKRKGYDGTDMVPME